MRGRRRAVELVEVGKDLRGTGLGFGCAGLSLADTPAHHEALLGTAWEAGVRWFDVARSYSYGAAEEILGRFLTGRRDAAAVVTKFGLAAPTGLAGSPAVRQVARRAVTLVPGLKRRLTSRADAAAPVADFSVAAASASLEASLRALRTDRVDALLLHEATPGALTDELHGWLVDQFRRGTVLHWGLATTSPYITAEVLAVHPWSASPVVQVREHLADVLPEPLTAPTRLVVSHSLIRHDLPRLRRRLTDDAALAGRVEKATGIAVSDDDILAPLLLSAAIARRPSGVALFSSRSLSRCTASARALDTLPSDAAAEAVRLLTAGYCAT